MSLLYLETSHQPTLTQIYKEDDEDSATSKNKNSYMTTLANATPEKNFGLGPDDDLKNEPKSADSSVAYVQTNPPPFPATPNNVPVGMPPESYLATTQASQNNHTLFNDKWSIRSHELLHANPSSMVMEDRALLQATNKKDSTVAGRHIDVLREVERATKNKLEAQRSNERIHATKIAQRNAREVTPYNTPFASLPGNNSDSPGLSNLENPVTSPPALNKKIYNNGLNVDYFREAQPEPRPIFNPGRNVSPVPGIPPPSQIYRIADLKAGCMLVMRKGYGFEEGNGRSVTYDVSYREPAAKLLRILCGVARDANDQCQYSLVWEIVEECRRNGSNVKETLLTLLTLFM